MSWFDEQLRNRKQSDDYRLNESIDNIARAIMGQRLTNTLSKGEVARSAIEQILEYYHHTPKEILKPLKDDSLEAQMELRLRPFGISYRAVELSNGWYKNAIGPMIGTLKKGDTSVALLPSPFYGYYYIDPETGRKKRIHKSNEALLKTEAVCFYEPFPQKKLTVIDLLKYSAKQLSASDLLIYILVMAGASALGLLSPMFNKWLFGDVLRSKNLQVLLSLACFMLCFSISRLLYSIFNSIIINRLTNKQDIATNAAVINRILSLPPSFFRNYSSGELQQRATYVQNLSPMIFSSVGNVGLTSLFSLIYLGQIFAFAPSLVLPSLSITLCTLAVTILATFVQMSITKQQMDLSAKSAGLSYSMITGIQKIKLSGSEKRLFVRWADYYAKEASLLYNPPLFLKLRNTLTMAISFIGTIILYYYAVVGNVSISDYYAFTSSYGIISGAFLSLASITTVFANIGPTVEMARPIMEAVPEAIDNMEIVTDIQGNIELNNVSFRYSDDMPWVLNNLSLKVHSGEYLAIVGTTGCGKSTLLRVLLGFEKPQNGTIYYDHKDISKLDIKSLRRRLGVVMQDGKLFWGDIFSNIIVAAPHLTLDDAWEAAEIASIADDIRAMPMGMNTMLSEGDGGISGGQRQRLLIARAIVSKPKVLMFDEATSALDNITQRKISEAIDKLNCTRIVIAHRLSTIRHCDRIIVLDKGHIAEEGTYEALIKKNGLFSELVARQRLDQTE